MGEALHDPAFFAWYGVLQLQARTMERIAKELEERIGMPASWYEVLACLGGEHDGEGCRMNELADELLISRGGATKLIARLEEAGYVRRVTPDDDRRATFAQLTDAGRAAAEAAHPHQLELTREYFGKYLTDEELAQSIAISTKVLRGIGAECGWLEMQAGVEDAEQAVGASSGLLSAPAAEVA
ncbi:MAG: MarR family transcriptional regulator [Solirubrobacteraceae bacterium]|nr:MarR family transcriptional regulator [Solirubrobacteraceae bacterium]